jgi:hypothetical protein
VEFGVALAAGLELSRQAAQTPTLLERTLPLCQSRDCSFLSPFPADQPRSFLPSTRGLESALRRRTCLATVANTRLPPREAASRRLRLASRTTNRSKSRPPTTATFCLLTRIPQLLQLVEHRFGHPEGIQNTPHPPRGYLARSSLTAPKTQHQRGGSWKLALWMGLGGRPRHKIAF